MAPIHAQSTDAAVALRSLVDGYAHAVDRGDARGFADLFAPDATLTTYRLTGEARHRYTGRDELASIPPLLRRYERTLHLISTHHCDVDGDTARGEAYCQAHHLEPATDGRSLATVQTICYVDRYGRIDGDWRFAERHVHMEWVEHREVERG